MQWVLKIFLLTVFLTNCMAELDYSEDFNSGYNRPPKTCPPTSVLEKDECVPFNPDPDPAAFPIVRENDPEAPSHLVVAEGINIPAAEEGVFHALDSKLFRYFPGADIGNVQADYANTGLQIIEWPGIKTDGNKPDDNSFRLLLETKNKEDRDERGKSLFIPLNYQGDRSLFDSYACNRRLGTHIRVMAFRPEIKTHPVGASPDNSYSDYVPFYLAYGEKSFHFNYIQPLHVAYQRLNELAVGHTNSDCFPITNEEVDKRIYPTGRKLNEVYSFTFANRRLLLGMYCGILIVDNVDAATLKLSAGRKFPSSDYEEENQIQDTYAEFKADQKKTKHQKFIHKINIITSSVCCNDKCKPLPTIAAAYSYDQGHTEQDMKILYVSFNNGDSWAEKVISPSYPATLIRLLWHLFTNVESELKLGHPEFITKEMRRLKKQNLWNNGTDHVVRKLLGKGLKQVGAEEKESPPVGETVCAEIVSMEAVPEEANIVALCRVSRGSVDEMCHPQPRGLHEHFRNVYYAVFKLELSRFSPLVHAIKKTTRHLACTLKNRLIPKNIDAVGKNFTSTTPNTECKPQDPKDVDFLEPAIIRARRSFNIFMTGCHSVLYYSVNGGITFWNAIFYSQAPNGQYVRFTQHPKFDRPLVALDPNGQSITFTFDDYYAFAMINYNRELRFIIGKVLDSNGRIMEKGLCCDPSKTAGSCDSCKNTILIPPGCDTVHDNCIHLTKGPQSKGPTTQLPLCKSGVNNPPSPADCEHWTQTQIPFSSKRKVAPYYSNSAAIRFSLSVMDLLLPNVDQTLFNMYQGRKGIRLIDIPVKITEGIRPFFAENTMLGQKKFGFIKCPTYAFKLNKKDVNLDYGENVTVQVAVEDLSPNLPLGIFSGLSNLLEMDVQETNKTIKSEHEVRLHDWEVYVVPQRVKKPILSIREDEFFGSSYTPYVQQTSNFVVTTFPQMRCHTQPTGSVQVVLGCGKKILVAHEDYHRPQCGKFFNNNDHDQMKPYKFTLKEGQYDPELMKYWMTIKPQLYKFKENSKDIQATYDYQLFGCPLLPYGLEEFKPDLRILDLEKHQNISDTIVGTPFKGQYVLIEVFGQKGYTHTQTVEQAKCKRPPLKIHDMKKRWKDRRNVIFNAHKAYRLFHPEEVAKPENIWPKSSHKQCEIPDPKLKNTADESQIVKNDPYEIMHYDSPNSIEWNKDHKDLYFFLAVDVDQNGTYCDFKAYFAVTIKTERESVVWISILRFFGFLLGLTILVILGYYARRTYNRRVYLRQAELHHLERGAWEILLRYERFLHEHKMGPDFYKGIDPKKGKSKSKLRSKAKKAQKGIFKKRSKSAKSKK